MEKHSIYIKNMVCPRCIMAVEQLFFKLNIPFITVNLGEVVLQNPITNYSTLDDELEIWGFKRLESKAQILSETIKTIIIDFIHYNKGEALKINFSAYLAKKLGYEYSFLSATFSTNENITIEKFIILQKIERVKELISYGELNFSEIAFQLNYSSPSHLSKQFKKVTGFTLSSYKKSRFSDRNTIDKVL